MANFDKVNDVVLTYADLYAKAFSANAPVDTGRLKNSYRASVSAKGDTFVMQIFGEYYGPFQSFGVGPKVAPLSVPDGVNPPPRTGNTYQFRNPNRYIPAQNFMGRAIDSVTPRFAEALEEAGVQDIDNFFDSLSKIEVS